MILCYWYWYWYCVVYACSAHTHYASSSSNDKPPAVQHLLFHALPQTLMETLCDIITKENSLCLLRGKSITLMSFSWQILIEKNVSFVIFFSILVFLAVSLVLKNVSDFNMYKPRKKNVYKIHQTIKHSGPAFINDSKDKYKIVFIF